MLFIPIGPAELTGGTPGVACLCSPMCLARFLNRVPDDQLPCGRRPQRSSGWQTSWCQVCGFCGRLMWKPTDCLLHGADCPPVDWMRTTDALTFALATTAMLGNFPPDEAWDLAVALGSPSKGERPAAEDVAKAVVRHLARYR